MHNCTKILYLPLLTITSALNGDSFLSIFLRTHKITFFIDICTQTHTHTHITNILFVYMSMHTHTKKLIFLCVRIEICTKSMFFVSIEL